MWLLKGIILGAVLFMIGFFAYALAVAHRIHLSTASVISYRRDL